MKIIVDAMGGDNAPFKIIKGACDAAAEFGVSVILVGREDEINGCLDKIKRKGGDITVRNATEIITMRDDPATACRRKKDSSMTVCLRLLAEGEGDAVVSAGSTGALLTGATLIVKRLRGIRRAALAPVLPNGGRGCVLIDSGANAECTPEYLVQFAYMGSFYANKILGCENPRVGLLNIGAEDTKGTPLQTETHELLSAAGKAGKINFIGNAEAGNVLTGEVDVLVADGFTGNILLKSLEGAVLFMLRSLKKILKKNRRSKFAAIIIRKGFRELRTMLDPSEIGGTAMLGISKPVIKAHGSSDAYAIRSAIGQAIKFSEADVIGEIKNNIARICGNIDGEGEGDAR